MKNSTFPFYVSKYFTEYLPNVKGSTPATIDSYRYAFVMYLEYMQERYGLSGNMIDMKLLTYDNVKNFLEWLEKERCNSISTRNQRQAVIKSFVHFLMLEFPDYLAEYQKILELPVKKAAQPQISYAKTDGISCLLRQPDQSTASGLRDYVMLAIMYTTGIRVSELINIKLHDVSLNPPATLLVHGKGRKSRYVPILKHMIPVIDRYICSLGYGQNSRAGEWMFKNHMGAQFTRQGVNYLVSKYKKQAEKEAPGLIPDDLSPHKIRHSTAMGLVEAGVDLIYIRDLLGHVSVKTTEIYAKTDAKLKRQALEAASVEIVGAEEPIWEKDVDLKNWLKTPGKPRL